MKPIVGMVAHEALPEPLLGLLSDIFSRARPVAFERGSGAPMHAAVVASRTLLASAPPRVPLAVWADNADDVDALVGVAAVQAILSSVRSVVARAGAKGVEVPAAPRPMPDVRPVAPAVRAHVRRGRGLTERAVAVLDDAGTNSWCGQPLAEGARDTALACASVVVASGDITLRAMAWGAPIVTDAATHRDLEFVPGQDAVVAGDGDVDAASAVDALLDDEPLAAALSWNARTFYERHFDTKYAVLDLSRKLDLVPSGAERVAAMLGELWTPVDAPAVARAYDRLAPFVR